MSANIDDNETALLSTIHEIAHSLEEAYPQIYEDETIETEFLGKRKKMYEILSAHGFDLSGLDFFNAEYSEKFDDFLYLVVGYPLLRNLSSGLSWLIPGIGAQGGDLEGSISIGNNNGVGIVNVSRAILYAGNGSLDAIVESAKNYTNQIREILWRVLNYKVY